MLEIAIELMLDCEYLLIIGSSMQVYPAASLAGFAPHGIPMYYIDPNPSINYELSVRPNLNVIPEKATIGLPMVMQKLLGSELR